MLLVTWECLIELVYVFMCNRHDIKSESSKEKIFFFKVMK